MSNRMAEQGLVAAAAAAVTGKSSANSLNNHNNNSSSDDLKITDPKEFLAKYKENELRQSSMVNNFNELTVAAAAAAAAVNNNINNNNNNNSHRISPRLSASPSANSEGSFGRSVSSPFLFDSAKITNPFTNPYLPAAAAAVAAANHHGANAFNANDFQKEFNNLANRFNPTLPLAPISPLSPFNAVSRLLFQNTSAIFGKRLNELQKLQNEQLLNQASKLLNPTIQQAALKQPTSKDLVEEMTNGMREFYGDIPEQDGPIDLSVKRITDFKELSLAASELIKCSKQIPGDHDSGFSPSSNEDNQNSSPLDLTSSNTTTTSNNYNKRLCLSNNRTINNGVTGGGKSTLMMMMKNQNKNKNNNNIINNNNNNNINGKESILIDIERMTTSMKTTSGSSVTNNDEDVDVEDEVEVDDDDGGDGDDETSDVEINDEDEVDVLEQNNDHHQLLERKKRREATISAC